MAFVTGEFSGTQKRYCPPELQHLWDIFLDLSNTRTYSHVAHPISWQEIGSYSGQIFPLTIWEKRLLRRIDDEVLSIINGKVLKRAKENKTKEPERISMKDPEGVKGFFRGLAATKRKGGRDDG